MSNLLDAQAIIFGLVLTNAIACALLMALHSASGHSAPGHSASGHSALRHSASSAKFHAVSDLMLTNVAKSSQLEANRPFFSVHIPTHNEPPEVVIATLKHVAALNYDQYEVILIDNNTNDPSLWQPVQTFCNTLGPRFKFFHRENVQGAKAGALNIAAKLTSGKATHFAIVDADYQVTPDFLTSAADAIQESGADFIQFPQAYRDHARAQSVATELADYFLTVASGTNRQQAMLLTGTLSVISRRAFEDVGGWSGETITEDAELGVRLYLGKHRGAYVHKNVGYGMLPLDFHGLTKQRDRWVAGNIQTLIVAMRAGLLPITQPALAIWTQLTAWVCLAAIPAIALLLVAFLPSNEIFSSLTATLAGATILVSLLSNPLSWWASDPLRPTTLGTWLRVRRVKLALLWTSSLAWVPVVFGAKPRFHCTQKAQHNSAQLFMPGLAAMSAIFGCVATIHFANGEAIAGISSALLASCWLAARCVDKELLNVHEDQSKGYLI